MNQQTETAVGAIIPGAAPDPLALLAATATAGAARFLNIGESTLEKLRVHGGGPEYVKASNAPNARVSYRYCDLIAWQQARVRRNTAGLRRKSFEDAPDHAAAA
jgi:hypothetical protein